MENEGVLNENNFEIFMDKYKKLADDDENMQDEDDPFGIFQ